MRPGPDEPGSTKAGARRTCRRNRTTSPPTAGGGIATSRPGRLRRLGRPCPADRHGRIPTTAAKEDNRFVPGLGGPRYRDDDDGHDEDDDGYTRTATAAGAAVAGAPAGAAPSAAGRDGSPR